MKKIIVSGLLIFVFVAYIIYQKTLPEDKKSTLTNSSTTVSSSTGKYKDGEYTSSVGDAFFGPLQIKLVIIGGKISDVVFVQYPNDRPTSTMINEDAIPILKQEAIQVQSSEVDIVSGATQTAEAYQLLLKETLAKAKA